MSTTYRKLFELTSSQGCNAETIRPTNFDQGIQFQPLMYPDITIDAETGLKDYCSAIVDIVRSAPPIPKTELYFHAGDTIPSNMDTSMSCELDSAIKAFQKRRRNSIASARFRNKKKEQELEMRGGLVELTRIVLLLQIQMQELKNHVTSIAGCSHRS